jgi:hypothetical protein
MPDSGVLQTPAELFSEPADDLNDKLQGALAKAEEADDAEPETDPADEKEQDKTPIISDSDDETEEPEKPEAKAEESKEPDPPADDDEADPNATVPDPEPEVLKKAETELADEMRRIEESCKHEALEPFRESIEAVTRELEAIEAERRSIGEKRQKIFDSLQTDETDEMGNPISRPLTAQHMSALSPLDVRLASLAGREQMIIARFEAMETDIKRQTTDLQTRRKVDAFVSKFSQMEKRFEPLRDQLKELLMTGQLNTRDSDIAYAACKALARKQGKLAAPAKPAMDKAEVERQLIEQNLKDKAKGKISAGKGHGASPASASHAGYKFTKADHALVSELKKGFRGEL